MIKVNNKQVGLRLDKFLFSLYPDITNSDLYKFIKKKEIKVNGGKVENNYILKQGDIIEFSNFIEKILINPKNKKDKKIQIIDEKYINLFKNSIIYEDENILAINKPYGLSVQDGTNIDVSIANIIAYINQSEHKCLKLVHRIDRTTTGTLLIAKNLESSNELIRMFKSKSEIKKYYFALTIGKFQNNNGIINIPLTKDEKSDIVFKDEKNGKEAITKYKVLKYSEKLDISLIQLQILTGRTHQIRVHLKEIGHPILGDFKYNKFKNKYISSDRIQLHSKEIKITLFNKKINIVSDIPEKMKTVIDNYLS